MTIQIDKDIPIPCDGRNGKSKYPFKDMEIGDSFYVEGKTAQQFANVKNYWAKKLKKEFTSKSEGHGCRTWRLS